MAGHRRAKAPGAPLLRKTKAERRWELLTERYGNAGDDLERLAAAYDFCRSTAKAVPASIRVKAVQEATEHLIRLAKQAADDHRKDV